jgi:hypothetical protein
MRPLLGADGVTVQRIDNGIAALLVFLVAGRQEYDDVTIDSVALKIAFKSCAVDLNALHPDRLCSGDDVGNVRLHLGREP